MHTPENLNATMLTNTGLLLESLHQMKAQRPIPDDSLVTTTGGGDWGSIEFRDGMPVYMELQATCSPLITENERYRGAFMQYDAETDAYKGATLYEKTDTRKTQKTHIIVTDLSTEEVEILANAFHEHIARAGVVSTEFRSPRDQPGSKGLLALAGRDVGSTHTARIREVADIRTQHMVRSLRRLFMNTTICSALRNFALHVGNAGSDTRSTR